MSGKTKKSSIWQKLWGAPKGPAKAEGASNESIASQINFPGAKKTKEKKGY